MPVMELWPGAGVRGVGRVRGRERAGLGGADRVANNGRAGPWVH